MKIVEDWKIWAGVGFDLFFLYPKWWFIEFVAKPVGRAHFRWEDEE